MKKVILSLCTLGLLASCSKKSNDEPQLPYMASIEERTYTVVPDTEEQGELRLKTITTLRPDGQTQAWETTDAEGVSVRKTTNEYNAQGKVVRSRFEETGASSTTEFVYNAAGLLVTEFLTPLNGTKSKTLYTYNAAGHRVSSSTYDMDDNGAWKDVATVSAEYEVDSKGLVLVSKAYTEGDLFMTTSFKYNTDGYVILTEGKGADGDMTTIKRTSYVAGKPGLEERIEQEVSFMGQNMPSSQTTYKYTFDEKGNWTKQIRLNDGKAVEIRTRTYTYK